MSYEERTHQRRFEYPNYDWIEGGGTMSYFKIDSQMRGWIERNLNR